MMSLLLGSKERSTRSLSSEIKTVQYFEQDQSLEFFLNQVGSMADLTQEWTRQAKDLDLQESPSPGLT